MDGESDITLSLAELEKRAIRDALQKSEGRVADAAVLLGINKKALWSKLSKLLPELRILLNEQ